MSFGTISIMPRYVRQTRAYNWCAKAFGKGVAENRVERGARFLEEAIELAQVCDVPKELAVKLVDRVYSRPVGTVASEVGGVGVTLLVLCELLGVSADDLEAREMALCEAKYDADPNYFANRLNAKAEAGVAMRSEV